VDLKQVLRSHPGDEAQLRSAIIEAMRIKPASHAFEIGEKPVIFRHMSATGG
jgi:cyclic pyranopterin phosphate synthase